MNEPSSGVPQQLIPHVHLVSTYRWPTLSTLGIDTVVDYLLQAPKITKEVAPMHWMFLDCPQDGTVYLVWQPLNQLGQRFATDGYVWADPEQSHCQEYRGYLLEMYIHRSGYNPAHEAVSAHCRRRYRLTPGPNQDLSIAACDPNLWIVHYSKADPSHHFPVNRIPRNPQVEAMMAHRKSFQQFGQLVRKEFMLEDRSNWPIVNLPGGHLAPQAQLAGYPANVMTQMTRSHQHAAYGQDQSASAQYGGPSPAKRLRPNPSQRPGANAVALPGPMAIKPIVDEEEDYARGDYLDLVTPKEISLYRYKQHHEWMEEILSSPYATGQIIPVELGLGRKGELESLTKDFFDAPTSETQQSNEPKAEPRIPGLGLGRAEEFTRRATARIAEINDEMEKMKRIHTSRMSKLRQGSLIRDAEKRLRATVSDPMAHGGGQPSAPTHGDVMVAGVRQQARIDEIANEVERGLNRKIEAVSDVTCIQKGGLEEKVLPDIAFETAILASAPSAALQDHSLADTVQLDDVPSFSEFDDKADWMQDETDPVTDSLDLGDAAVQVGNGIPLSEPPADLATQSQVGDIGDWVMVDRRDDTDNAKSTVEGNAEQLENLDATTAGKPDLEKIGTDLPEFGTNIQDMSTEGFESHEFDDAVDFSNLDTAGEALAGYEQQNDEMETDEHLGLDLGEDSAFGDAFHHTEADREEGEEGTRHEIPGL